MNENNIIVKPKPKYFINEPLEDDVELFGAVILTPAPAECVFERSGLVIMANVHLVHFVHGDWHGDFNDAYLAAFFSITDASD